MYSKIERCIAVILITLLLIVFQLSPVAPYVSAQTENLIYFQGFEDTVGWNVQPGVTANLNTENKTEGDSSLHLTFTKADAQQRWPNFTIDNLSSLKLKVLEGDRITFDLYPLQTIEGDQVPLKFKLSGGSNTIYEEHLPQGNVKEFKTIEVKAWKDSDNLSQFEFYIDKEDPLWNEYESLEYIVDNLRIYSTEESSKPIDPEGPEKPEELQNTVIFSYGFDTLTNLTTDDGVTAQLNTKDFTEGNASVHLTWEKHVGSYQWPGCYLPDMANLGIELRKDDRILIDVYPVQDSPGDSLPLVIKLTDVKGNKIYEDLLPWAESGGFTTIEIPINEDTEALNEILFYVYRNNSQWGDHTNLDYYIDNLRIIRPSESSSVILSDVVPGTILKNTEIHLTTEEIGSIYYTTNGSDPRTSESRQLYQDSITIDRNMTITAYLKVDDGEDSHLHYFAYNVVEAVDYEINGRRPGNIYIENEDTIFDISLKNHLLDTDIPLKFQYKITDYFGKTIYDSDVFYVNLLGGECLEYPLELNISKTGLFELDLEIESDDGLVEIESIIPFSRILEITHQDKAQGIFSLSTHFAYAKGDTDINASILPLTGAHMFRDDYTWDRAETTKGVVNIPASWDYWVDKAIDKGTEPLVILCYGNRLYDDGGIPYTEEGIDAWINYVKAVVDHFKDRVQYFEVWNEPNMYGNSTFNPTNQPPEVYANLLKVTYPAIKAINPGATVLGISSSGVDIPYIKGVLDIEGAYESMDAIAIHPYSWPVGPEASGLVSKVNALDALMEKYSNGEPTIPIWFTEMGWPSNQGSKGISELTVAQYLVRMHVLAMSQGSVENIFWYDLQDDGMSKTDPEHNFGLIRNWNDPVNPYGAKPSFVSYNVMAEKLIGSSISRVLKHDDNTNLYMFNRTTDDNDVIVAWNVRGFTSININVGDGTFRITDMFGNSRDYKAINGMIPVTLTESPIYIESLTGEIDENFSIGTDLNIYLETETINAIAGSTVDLTIKRSKAIEELSGQLNIAQPNGWEIIGDTAFGPGTDDIVLKSRIPEGTPNGAYEINILAESDSGLIGDVKGIVNVMDPLQVKLSPCLEDGKWFVKATLDNLLSNDVKGAVKINIPEAWDIGEIKFEVLAGEEAIIKIPIDDPSQDLYNMEFETTLDNGYSAVITRPISFMAAMKAKEPIIIDGKLSQDEWADSLEIRLDSQEQVQQIPNWGGIDELSGNAYLKWDNDNLYLAVEVKDDIHFQDAAAGDIWRGDGLQFAIDPGRSNVPGSIGYNEIGLALTNDGSIETWRWNVAVGDSGSFEAMDAMIVRNEETQTTIYEMSIPWDSIVPAGVEIDESFLFGFSLLINENDGEGREGWIQYMDGIGLSKDPTLFGDVILIPYTSEGEEPSPTEPPIEPSPTEPPIEPSPTEPPIEPSPTEPPIEPSPTEPPVEPDDGSDEAKDSYEQEGGSPKTGDNSYIWIWIALASFTLCILEYILYKQKQKG